MKRRILPLLLPLLLLALLCAGCRGTETPNAEAVGLPQDLIGTWVSADPGELDMVETLTFSQDGTLTVSCTFQGKDAGTVGGSCKIENGVLICDITEGASPYTVQYTFAVDGRELRLTDAEGTAQYLRAG